MTACAPNDRLLQTLRVHVPGATDPMIELELFNVMDEFFRRTSAWRFEVGIELTEASEYSIPVPADSIPVRTIGVVHNGIPVAPTSTGGTSSITQSSVGTLSPEATFPDGDATFLPALIDLSGSHVFTYAIYRPEYISFTGQITEEMRAFPVQLMLALSLGRGCLECDCGEWQVQEWMWDMFFNDWLDGSLARLYGMPAKPWTSNTHAVYHGKRFRNQMAYRMQESNRGFVYNLPAWRFPRTWT